MASAATKELSDDEKSQLQHAATSDVSDVEAAADQVTAIEPKGEGAVPQEELFHSIFSPSKKILILFTAATAMMLPPLTASMYYPVIPVLASELGVSINSINLTITAYLIFQGLAPSFVGNFSDEYGRRPAYLISFAIFVGGSIGLAIGGDYAVLMVLRCLQSAGSSGAIALAYATVSDLVTSAQRGSRMSYVQGGYMVSPAIAPVFGGLLNDRWGWRSIFWFLTVFSLIVWLTVFLFQPESSRKIVENGSIPPQWWNRPLISCLSRDRKAQVKTSSLEETSPPRPKAHFNPFSSVQIFFVHKELSILILYSGLIYATTYFILSSLPDLIQNTYGFTTLQTSLCFLATGTGTTVSILFVGRILDRNFRRHARNLGLSVSNSQQQDLTNFPIERARLQVSIPFLTFAAIALIGYGWAIRAGAHVAAPLVLLFCAGMGYTGGFQGLSSLIVDLNRERTGTTVAAMNMARCWMGAGGVAISSPLIGAVGAGWAFTVVAGLWTVFGVALVWVWRWGPEWRRERALKGN